MHLDVTQCVCDNGNTAEDLNGDLFCYTDNNDYCNKLFTNAYYDASAQYRCSCNDGYEFEYMSYEGQQIPYRCKQKVSCPEGMHQDANQCVCDNGNTGEDLNGNPFCYADNNEYCNKLLTNAYSVSYGPYKINCECNRGYYMEYMTYEGQKFPYRCIKQVTSCPDDMYYDTDDYMCKCKDPNKRVAEGGPNGNFCFGTMDEMCEKMLTNAHHDESAKYKCSCNEGYEMEYETYEGEQIPKQCVGKSQNNNETCVKQYGEFAYYNTDLKQCACKNNYILYNNQFCKEGNNYCKLMSPSEPVYYDPNKGCVCGEGKKTANKPGASRDAVVCYSTFEELCPKVYPNTHYNPNGPYDVNCDCNEGYTKDQTSKSCVKIEDDSSISTLIILVITLILALI